MDVVEKSLPSPSNRAHVPVDARRIAPQLGSAPRAKPRRKKCRSFSQRHTASPIRLAVRMTIPCSKKCNTSCNFTNAVAMLFTLLLGFVASFIGRNFKVYSPFVYEGEQ
jgi:hypothetical protein